MSHLPKGDQHRNAISNNATGDSDFTKDFGIDSRVRDVDVYDVILPAAILEGPSCGRFDSSCLIIIFNSPSMIS